MSAARRFPTLSRNDSFDGDFDLLPFAAGVEFGPVPEYPLDSDFQMAGMRADESPAARWQCEAIRWRRANPGKPLNDGLKSIALRVAAALHRLVPS